MSFIIRKFEKELKLGEKIKSLRKAANITIGEMENNTKISKTILKAFEAGDYTKLPEPIYARNFLKIIAKTLKTDETYFLDLYENECGACDYVQNARLPRQRTHALRFFVASRLVKIFFILFIALSLIGYLGLQIREIIKAPSLSISAPVDGLTTQDATIFVSGESELGSQVLVNGELVLLSTDGHFEQEVALERGVNVIMIEGAKRYSKKALLYRRVILDHKDSGVNY